MIGLFNVWVQAEYIFKNSWLTTAAAEFQEPGYVLKLVEKYNVMILT